VKHILVECVDLNNVRNLCWIPSHVGILGNEKADAATKSALSLSVTCMKLPATDIYPIHHINREWH